MITFLIFIFMLSIWGKRIGFAFAMIFLIIFGVVKFSLPLIITISVIFFLSKMARRLSLRGAAICEVDNLVPSQRSYLDFSGIVPSPDEGGNPIG